MAVTIVGNNTPTAGGVVYGDGTNYASTSAGSAGGVLYSAGTSAPAFTAAGTSGQVLTSAGSGAPTWAAPAAGGSWIYLTSVTASASSSVSIESNIDSTYDAYVIVAENVYITTAAALNMQWKIAGAFVTSANYDYSILRVTPGSASSAITQSTSDTNSPILTGTNPTGGGWPSSFNLYFFYPNETSNAFTIFWNGAAGGVGNFGYMRISTTGAKTGVKFIPASGTITTGTFRLYGIKNS
jgi:hypothetical protein